MTASSAHTASSSTPGRSRCKILTRGAPANPPAAPVPRARPITLDGTAWWRKITMMTSSSPAPIVFTNMISIVATRSTGWPHSVRTPASMLPRPAAGLLSAVALLGWPAGLFMSAAVTSATRKEAAVKRNGMACASARTA